MNDLKISAATAKRVQEALSEASHELIQEMKVIGADYLKVSLDLNLEMPGKEIGIKYSLTKVERTERCIDEPYRVDA